MSRPHIHHFSRFMGSAIVRGDEMLSAGCRDCDRVITFHAQAKAALTVNRVLDAILRTDEISTHELMEDCEINARGYLVRILRHLRDQGHIRMVRRGVYGPQRPEAVR